MWVSSTAQVSGEARLHVDGRASPLQRFDTAPTGATVQLSLEGEGLAVDLPAVVPAAQPQHQIVLDAAWTNERLDVPTAIEAGHVIDITVSDLRAVTGSCSDVVFTVEQGVFQPNVDERLWIAELTRRGGPELRAWLAAEERRKEEIRQAHYAMAEQRSIEWQVQLEARREAARVEAIAIAEATRVEAAQRVAEVRADEERRESIREAHYAEYERRREARVEVAQQVAVAAPVPATGVCRERPVVAGGVPASTVMSGSAAASSCEPEPVVAYAPAAPPSGSIVMTGATTQTATGSVVTTGARTSTTEAQTASGAVVTAGGAVGLESRTVSSEQVAAESASFPGWSTPTTFSRVTVSSEQVAPAPPPSERPRVVETRVDGHVVVGVLDVLSALFSLAAPPPQPVHRAVPATPPASSTAAPPPPPAR